MTNWIVYVLLGGVAAAMLAAPLVIRARPKSVVEGDPPAGIARSPKPPFGLSRGQLATLIGVAAVLAAATALFLATDDKTPVQPPGLPMAGGAPGGKVLPDVDTMITRLAKRLEAAPNDPEGWRMLGWSYVATQHYPEAVKAYAKAVGLTPGDAAYRSAYGEAIAKAAGDKITPEAEAAFRKSLAIDPKDERARAYLALLRHQSGDSRGALDELFAILKAAAPESPMAPTLRETIRKVGAEAGIDVSDRLPPEPAGPTAADVQAAQQLPAQDQQAMIDSMVARLEARLATSPNDVDGWVMLIRSRKKLGQDDQAKAALVKARSVFGGDAAAKTRLEAAARDLGLD